MRQFALGHVFVCSLFALGALGQGDPASTTLSIRSRVTPSGIPHTATSSVSIPIPVPASTGTLSSSGTTFTTLGPSGTILPPPPPLSDSSTSSSSSTLTSPASSSSSSGSSSSSSSTSSTTSTTPTTTSNSAVAQVGMGGALSLVLVPLFLQIGLL